MRVLGLKYVGKREEGIMVMLFKSYKTVKITKTKPYRFTPKDRVDDEACNYYRKLANLGLALIQQESELAVKATRTPEVRTEPLAAETDVQLDPTTVPATPEDQIPDTYVEESNETKEVPPVVDETEEDEPTGLPDPSDEDVAADKVPSNSGELAVDKEIIKAMSLEEICEYLEMNFSKDQIKTLISDMGLDISVGRKGVPTLIGEIVAATDLENLVNYLCK